jgi:hypothetical protein
MAEEPLLLTLTCVEDTERFNEMFITLPVHDKNIRDCEGDVNSLTPELISSV